MAKAGAAPCALIETWPVIGPPVAPAFAARSASDNGSNAPAFEPAGRAAPLSQTTASMSMFQIFAARSRKVRTTLSVAWDTAMPAAKVTRLPPVVALMPMEFVSPIWARTFL